MSLASDFYDESDYYRNYEDHQSYRRASMKVPFLNLKATYLELQQELDAAYRQVMQSGWYILGQK